MQIDNTQLIKICMEVKNKRGFKVHKIVSFSYNLIMEKKIRKLEMLKNYLLVYYKPSNNTLQKALRILEKYDLITLTKRLGDCRSWVILPNIA